MYNRSFGKPSLRVPYTRSVPVREVREREREDTTESYRVIKGLIEGKRDPKFHKSRRREYHLPGKRNKRSQLTA